MCPSVLLMANSHFVVWKWALCFSRPAGTGTSLGQGTGVRPMPFWGPSRVPGWWELASATLGPVLHSSVLWLPPQVRKQCCSRRITKLQPCRRSRPCWRNTRPLRVTWLHTRTAWNRLLLLHKSSSTAPQSSSPPWGQGGWVSFALWRAKNPSPCKNAGNSQCFQTVSRILLSSIRTHQKSRPENGWAVGAVEEEAELYSCAKFPSSSSSLCCHEPFPKESGLLLAYAVFQGCNTVILFQEQKERGEGRRVWVCSLLLKKKSPLFQQGKSCLGPLWPHSFPQEYLHCVHSVQHMLQGIFTADQLFPCFQLGNLHLHSFSWSNTGYQEKWGAHQDCLR